ncbi:hypothetical protein KC19_11G109000 [Ceratodon purpureus]|uniref:F-box domain-containing protein n=1 Tax=Ceratodon purpureus TaxID=3225 RepID=A0A8T0GJ90_CERPU|nr:hypothetical protein KC19_11G109000 [Ceratodon purpureus]
MWGLCQVQMDFPMCLLLPRYLLEDILNRLEDAREIAKAQCVCKEFLDAGNDIRSLRIIVLDIYHEQARNIDLRSLRSQMPGTSNGGEASTSQSKQDGNPPLKFKDQMVQILVKKRNLVQLRFEVDSRLQSKAVPEDEKRRTDFWISDPYFVRKWIPAMKSTLEHLCIVDYGQQAIMRRSSIIKILSQYCKRLKTLDLRNMFIETSDCEEMPLMVSLTWRCVKVTGGALQDINTIMPNLQTLALLGVFGVERGVLKFQEIKVLCLGLSTPAKEVTMDLPKLEKLQLKMQCPQKLIIKASILKYLAFNLEVMEPSKVELKCMAGLQELLYGASSFVTLSSLIEKNPNLKKIFLDIPCMALAEDGRFLGVLKDVPLMLPDFTKLHECESLEILNIGPGLWHCMETNVEILESLVKWPSMSCLILHMIPQNLELTVKVLRMLLRLSVKFLTIYVHTSSAVKLDILQPKIKTIVSECEQHINEDIKTWTKSLDFSCFSF